MVNGSRRYTEEDKGIIIMMVIAGFVAVAFACAIASAFLYKTSFIQDYVPHPYIQVPCKLITYNEYQTTCTVSDDDGYYPTPGTGGSIFSINNKPKQTIKPQKEVPCTKSDQTWQVTVNNSLYSRLFHDEDPKGGDIQVNVSYLCYCKLSDPANTIRFDDDINKDGIITVLSLVLFAILATLCAIIACISRVCCPCTRVSPEQNSEVSQEVNMTNTKLNTKIKTDAEEEVQVVVIHHDG